jgi:prepilin-type processing-associated H-X9-DG protein
MFKILGADGKEYGPVTAEVLRQWIADRRAAAQTKVQVAGSTEWKPLAEYPEFAAVLRSTPPPVPPPLGSPPVAPGSSAKVQAIQTSGLAIASLVLGILGFCSGGLSGLVGVVLGVVALKKIRREPARLKGRGLAIAGICVSTFFIGVLIFVLPALLLPALSKARQKSHTIDCVNQVKEIGLAVRLYADENDGQAPAAVNWCDAILPNLPGPESLRCPSRRDQRSGYGLNRRLAGRTLSSIPPDTVMIFEIAGGWNVTGGEDDLLPRSPHGRQFVVGFADGSVRQVPADELPALRWEP